MQSNCSVELVRVNITLNRIVISVLPMMITFFTVLGNTFVIIAICINTRINRRNTSVLVLNLAVADLLVGSTVMPINVVQILTDGVWLMSRTMCKLYASLDVVLCTASIVTLCIISVERFVGVTRPLNYSYLVTRRRLKWAVAFVWMYSLTVLLATIDWADQNSVDNVEMPLDSCTVGGELQYIMESVTFSFVVPLFIVLVVYVKIFDVVRNRQSNLCQLAANSNMTERRPLRCRLSVTNRLSTASRHSVVCDDMMSLRLHYGGSLDVDAQRQRHVFQKQMKTAKTLGIVVGAFVFCWLPFFVLYLINHMCPDSCNLPSFALEVSSWLGYANSAINPVIYAVSMRTFSSTFKKMCNCFGCCCCDRKKRLGQSKYFTSSFRYQSSRSTRSEASSV